MSAPASSTDRVQFGVFELDLRAHELRRRGIRVKLQEQPLQVLLILLEHPGRLVTRDELRRRIWPADTFIEFDQGLYSALRRLREALNDSADHPSYIETVPKQGYRFVAHVERTAESKPTEQRVDAPVEFQSGPEVKRKSTLAWWAGGALAIASFAGVGWWALEHRHKQGATDGPVRMERLTDFVGLEGEPAISPDGRFVAFVADTTGQRQIWVMTIGGGAPLQLTQDAAEHAGPRWRPDAASLIYYVHPPEGEIEGTIWEISALGGNPRMITKSLSQADISHDGERIAYFRLNEKAGIELVTRNLGSSEVSTTTQLSSLQTYDLPRWSPDDKEIAFMVQPNLYANKIAVVPVGGGAIRLIADEDVLMDGFCWKPDGSGIIYSSSRESTVLYLPTMHLWEASIDGRTRRQLTYGETSLGAPDIDCSERIVASRMRMGYGIWKVPIGRSPVQNVKAATEITHETGQVQTPSVGPADHELAYLSDDGSHGNIWVMNLETGVARQITSERDPRVAMGLPVWSPDGAKIAFVSNRDTANWDYLGLWVVRPDGSGLERVVPKITGYPTWSDDGHWLYFDLDKGGDLQIWKVAADGGTPVQVRGGNTIVAGFRDSGRTLFFLVPKSNGSGTPDYEVRAASPEDNDSKLLVRIDGRRVPKWQTIQPAASHDGKWLAVPLTDGPITNLFLISGTDGRLRQVTDFGSKRTFIVRRVSWSSDDRFLFAAIADGDSDVVTIDGLRPE
jgi:Tol biopolymer transport system component/DNA-binding winged helix-turn-helix (wHTH) protein